MTKLVLHSNAPYAPTGYGNQTGLFAPFLKADYDLAISAFYGLEGAPLIWQGIPILPGLGGEYGNGPLLEHVTRWFGGDPRNGLVMTLLDVWVLNTDMAAKMNVASWVPVDHEPCAPAVVDYFKKTGACPIAMSSFGERELKLAGLDPLYCPHGVDTDVFKPYPQAEVRKAAGIPEDAFLVGIVAANKGRPSRKCFAEMFQAFRLLREKHDNAILYVHSNINPEHGNGEHLIMLLESLGVPDEAVRFADQYAMTYNPAPPAMMAQLYSTMDVLMNCSMGEGFGIPVLEAQACGVPGIVTNFSAMPEVCGSGWHVACRPRWTYQNSWMAAPDVDDMVAALESCYRASPEMREKLAQKARMHALDYHVPKVYREHMLPALEEAADRFGLKQREQVAA